MNEIAAPEISPFPGLRPFREDETHLFFGRETHRRELLKRLSATRFIAVVGTSGSGKSSLVRAGLLPDLYSGYLPKSGSDWVVVDMAPGNDPIGRLAIEFGRVGWTVSAEDLRTNSTQIIDMAARLLGQGQHLLVLVDQFEEFFRLRAREHPLADRDEKASFVRLLLNAGGQVEGVHSENGAQVHVVIAMRSEYLGRASAHTGFPEAIDQGQYLIPRLSREQLREAIVHPVHVADGAIEESLVQRLLNELGNDQDQLPILQHALMRTWDVWKARGGIGKLDDDCYTKSGMFDNALSNDASEVLQEATAALGADGERIIKRVFQSLRETDVNGGQSRRPTAVGELCEIVQCDRATLAKALEPFRRRSFLRPSLEESVVAGDGSLPDSVLVDVSHEALLRRWTTLKRWIEEDELDRRLYLRIASRAADEAGSQSPDYFVRPLLPVLEKFWNDRQPPRAWAVRHHPGYEAARAFLDASGRNQKTVDEEELRAANELATANAKRARAKERTAIAFGLLVLVVLAGGWFVKTQVDHAYLLQRRVDEANRATADANRATDVAREAEDQATRAGVDLKKQVTATETANMKATEYAARLETQAARLETQAARLESQVVATKAAANSADSDIELRLQLAAEALRRQPLLADAQRLLLQTIFAAAKPIGEVRLLNPGARGPVPASGRVALSTAGDVAFISRNANLVAIRVATKQVTYSVPLEDSYLVASADGKRLVAVGTALASRRVRVLDAATGQQLAVVEEVGRPLAWSVSGGSDLAAFATGDSVFLCQLSTNCSSVTRNVLKDSGARDIELSLDGSVLAVDSSQAPAERALALYETSPWQHRQTRTHSATGIKRSMSLNDRYLAFCSSTTLTFYDAYDFSLDPSITDRSFPAEAIQCSFATGGVVTRHRDGTLRVWNNAGIQIGMAGRTNDDAVVAVALGGPYVAALGEQLKLWEVSSYGRKLDVPLRRGFYRGGAYTLADAGRYDVESGEPRPGVRLPRGEAAISESLRGVVFLRIAGKERQLVYGEIKEAAAPIEKWSWPLPAAEPGVLRSPSISISWDDRFVTARREDATQDVRGRENVTVRQEDVRYTTTILDAGSGKDIDTVPGEVVAFVPKSDDIVVRERSQLSLRRISGKELRRLSDDEARLRVQRGGLLFSPDGNVLAVAEAAGGDSSDKRRWGVTVWAWPSLRFRYELQHSAAVTSLAFRRDSMALLTATEGATIHAWDLGTGQEIARVPVSASGLTGLVSVAFTPAGDIAFNDGRGLTVLPSNPNAWIREACARISTNLSEDEWKRIIGSDIKYQRTCGDRP